MAGFWSGVSGARSFSPATAGSGGGTPDRRNPNSSGRRTLFPVLSFPILLEAPAFVAFITDPDEEPHEFDGNGRLLGTAEKAALSRWVHTTSPFRGAGDVPGQVGDDSLVSVPWPPPTKGGGTASPKGPDSPPRRSVQWGRSARPAVNGCPGSGPSGADPGTSWPVPLHSSSSSPALTV